MSKFLGFGSGRDGVVPSSGTPNTYATMLATAGQQQVTTNLSVAIGDIVMLAQMYNGVPGNFEFVVVIATGVGSFTAGSDLDNSYIAPAQAIKVFQASGGVISGTLVPQAWDGSTGGFGVIFGGGKILVDGLLNGTGYGFRGGSGSGSCNCGSNPSYSGEGTGGVATFGLQTANGNGGGGVNGNGMDAGPGGAGGSYGTSGQNGSSGQGTGGTAGDVVGSADMQTIHLGGGGGGGRGEKNGGASGGNGAIGGGGWIVFARELVFSATGGAVCDGNNGGNASPFNTSDGAGGGGAGSGGLLWFKAQFLTIANASNIHCNGGVKGNGGNNEASRGGGDGGLGRIRLEACKITISSGSANPAPSTLEGGFNFCGSLASMIE